MPGIGNPNARGANGFNKIRINKSASDRISKKNANEIGDDLNGIAGVKAESRFVDKDKHNKLGKDGFLKLLSHQLANQDPLKPMDQKRFAADLAQFSQLEQLANMNSQMKNAQKNQPSEDKFYGASFLGKKVLTSGTSVDYEVGKRPELPFFLEKAAKKVFIKIFDSSNNLTRTIEVDGMGQGSQTFSWDGRSEQGTSAVKGKYRFSVQAYDDKYEEFKGQTQAEGIVTGVNFEHGETVLVVDGQKKVFLRDVAQFKVPEMTKGAKNMPTLKKSADSAYNKTVQQNH